MKILGLFIFYFGVFSLPMHQIQLGLMPQIVYALFYPNLIELALVKQFYPRKLNSIVEGRNL